MKLQSSQSRRQIALLVETSLGSGREILRGIAQFARDYANWEIFHAARGLEDSVPDWLQTWGGDGVIARIQNEGMLQSLKKLDAPIVDVLGVPSHDFPLVQVDDALDIRSLRHPLQSADVGGHVMPRVSSPSESSL